MVFRLGLFRSTGAAELGAVFAEGAGDHRRPDQLDPDRPAGHAGDVQAAAADADDIAAVLNFFGLQSAGHRIIQSIEPPKHFPVRPAMNRRDLLKSAAALASARMPGAATFLSSPAYAPQVKPPGHPHPFSFAPTTGPDTPRRRSPHPTP